MTDWSGAFAKLQDAADKLEQTIYGGDGDAEIGRPRSELTHPIGATLTDVLRHLREAETMLRQIGRPHSD